MPQRGPEKSRTKLTMKGLLKPLGKLHSKLNRAGPSPTKQATISTTSSNKTLLPPKPKSKKRATLIERYKSISDRSALEMLRRADFLAQGCLRHPQDVIIWKNAVIHAKDNVKHAGGEAVVMKEKKTSELEAYLMGQKVAVDRMIMMLKGMVMWQGGWSEDRWNRYVDEKLAQLGQIDIELLRGS